MNSTTQQSVLFPDLFDKPLVVAFDQEHSSSDGGAVFLKAADKRLGLTDSLAACLRDERQTGKIDHDTVELFRQRVYGIACGYSDCNDVARLANDPVHKMINDRDPIEGDALASQSTLSRFENSVGPLTLYRMGNALFETVIDSHRKRLGGRKVRRIVIDPGTSQLSTAESTSWFLSFGPFNLGGTLHRFFYFDAVQTGKG